MTKKHFLIDIYTRAFYDFIKGTGYLTGNITGFILFIC